MLLTLEGLEHRRGTVFYSALVVNRVVGASPDPPLAHPVGIEHRGRRGRRRGLLRGSGIAALGKFLPWSLWLPRRQGDSVDEDCRESDSENNARAGARV
jgi:hypothetical protein